MSTPVRQALTFLGFRLSSPGRTASSQLAAPLAAPLAASKTPPPDFDFDDDPDGDDDFGDDALYEHFPRP